MPDLIFCITTLNSGRWLRKCLDSITPYADRIIIVDGRFKGNPSPDVNSTDDTLQIAEEYGCEIIKHDGTLLQHKVRDLYLIGEEGDIYFTIDSDTILEGTLNKQEMLESDHNVWAVYRIQCDGRRELWLWAVRHQPGIHHHFGLLREDGEGRLMDGTYPKGAMLEGCWMRHLKVDTPEEYQAFLKTRTKEYVEAHA